MTSAMPALLLVGIAADWLTENPEMMKVILGAIVLLVAAILHGTVKLLIAGAESRRKDRAQLSEGVKELVDLIKGSGKNDGNGEKGLLIRQTHDGVAGLSDVIRKVADIQERQAEAIKILAEDSRARIRLATEQKKSHDRLVELIDQLMDANEGLKESQRSIVTLVTTLTGVLSTRVVCPIQQALSAKGLTPEELAEKVKAHDG